MFRLATKSLAFRQSIQGSPQRLSFVRHQSSGGSGGGGGVGRLLVTTTVTAVGLAGGTIGYASVDPEFRTLVQDTVPGSKDILDNVLGEETSAKAAPKKQEIIPPSKMKIPMTSSPPMPAIEKPAESKKKEEVPAPVTLKEAKPTPAPTPVKETAPKPKESIKPSKPEGKNEVAELEKAIEETCKEMDAKVKKAIESSKASIDATKHHMVLVRGLMDDTSSPKDEKRAWNEVFEAVNKKSDLLKETDKFLSEAKASLNATISTIEKGRKSSITQDNNLLKLADERAAEAVNDLEKVVAALGSVQKEAKLIDEYRNLVEEGRQQFQKEIEAILPGTNLSQKSGGLSEEELNIFMTHAYRKVCQLQEELAKAQTIGKRTPNAEGGEDASNIDVQSELDAQRRELEVAQHRKLTALREEMEREMRTQLRRQTAAHADHIKDVLEVQSKELTRLHERSLDENLTNEKASHKRELATIKGALEGLNKSLEDKNFMANASFDSQELWLACVALQKSVDDGAEKSTIDSKIKAIEKAVGNSVAFQKDEFIQALLKTIPKSQPLSPSSEIKTRFNKVETMARRTALIGEEGGSLLIYALSYLQSLLVFEPSKSTPAPAKNEEAIDVSSLNTFDIVWLARRSLEVDDLEQAVKYMNLLSGESRRQAFDWINSAKLHLEMRQISEALASHALGIGAEAIPVSRSSS